MTRNTSSPEPSTWKLKQVEAREAGFYGSPVTGLRKGGFWERPVMAPALSSYPDVPEAEFQGVWEISCIGRWPT